MRKLSFGIVLAILGIMILAFAKVKITTNEDTAKVNSVSDSKGKVFLVKWSPFVGFVLIVGGMMIFVRAKRKIVRQRNSGLLKISFMKQKSKSSLRKGAKQRTEKLSSYDTSREETSTPQKIREGNEPEAIRQRSEKSK